MRGLHDPRKVRGAHLAVDDGTGDAKTSGVNFIVAEMRSGEAREFLNNKIEGTKFLAGKTVAENGGEFAALFRDRCRQHVSRGDAAIADCASDGRRAGPRHRIPPAPSCPKGIAEHWRFSRHPKCPGWAPSATRRLRRFRRCRTAWHLRARSRSKAWRRPDAWICRNLPGS